MVLGRDPQCDVPLASREISRRHAEIRFLDGECTVRDLSSANGTFLDGAEVRGRMVMREGSRLRLGPFTFLLRGGRLVPASQKGKIRIELRDLSKTVSNATTGQPLTLLEDVSLVIEPNQFVALLGPSGSGKSTLMDAINGRRPATTGQVLVNGEDFYQSYRYYRRAIGYVPQQDIVHATLTVEQAFQFTARLRLPPDTSEAERGRIVDEVIARMGLTERRHTLISHLSGGQLKRVSLGAELIADPGLLFLDEATSGLDAGTEAKMMRLFREVANEGKTVVCITHNVENIGLCDRVVVLARGKLVYYGPPGELPGFFGVSSVSEVYDRIESRPAEEWAKQYRASRFYVSAGEKAGLAPAIARPAQNTGATDEAGRQFSILAERSQDRRNLLLLLAQAPLIGVLIGAVFGGNLSGHDARLVVFLMAISAIWFGCINACREIVKELPIYLRERAVNLELLPYLGSKVAVLSGLCAAQCLALYLIVASMTGLEGSGGQQFATLCLTSGCGMMMGLVVSALMSNADKAMAVIPVLLIPQVILADIIPPLGDGMRLLAQWLVPAFRSVDAMVGTLPKGFLNLHGAKHEWGADMLALVAMAVALAGLASAALKRKDSL
jgi:ABC-type multidrug transport system ATPase subunit